jgi:hypothetical protein
LATPHEFPAVSPSTPNGEDDRDELPTAIELMKLAKRYGSIAERVYHFEGQLDAVHGIALAAHGVASRVERRLEDVAHAVKAKRGTPIPPAFMSDPPPPPGEVDEIEASFNVSPTGTHFVVTDREMQRIKAQWAEKEARARGAREYAQKLKENAEEDDRKMKRLQRNVLFAIGIAVPFFTGLGYCLEHFHWVK